MLPEGGFEAYPSFGTAAGHIGNSQREYIYMYIYIYIYMYTYIYIIIDDYICIYYYYIL